MRKYIGTLDRNVVLFVVLFDGYEPNGRREAVRNMSSTHNILVISDLHLGEGLTPGETSQLSHDLRLAERQLVAFLRRYTNRRADGRPWRLVINGDMVDFLGVQMFPAPDVGDADDGTTDGITDRATDDTADDTADDTTDDTTDDERRYGLDRRRDAACARVEAVIAHHQPFFRALAGFLAAGNAVEITCGNHDTELYWPEVQRAMADGIVHSWLSVPASSRLGAASARAIRERLRFHAWFFHEPGVAWIEHGHRYDECCSYAYHLHPVDETGDAIGKNVDAAAMRYLSNSLPERAHGSEEWSAVGYLRFALGMGVTGAWKMARGYYQFSASLLRAWWAARQARQTDHPTVHRQRLTALSAQWSLSTETLTAVDRLGMPPVVSNLRRLAAVLMLDKVLLCMLGLLVVIAAAIWFPLWTLPFASAAVAIGVHRVIAWLTRDRSVNPTQPLSAVPAEILEQVDARFVVFGHTHRPVARRIPGPSRGRDRTDDTWYFNTGTWVPSGKQGLMGSFTHAVIRSTPDGRVHGQLCQWRDGASRLFEPERPVADVRPTQVPVPARERATDAAAVARAA